MAAAMTDENADAADDSDNSTDDVVFDDEADMVIVAATRILTPATQAEAVQYLWAGR